MTWFPLRPKDYLKDLRIQAYVGEAVRKLGYTMPDLTDDNMVYVVSNRYQKAVLTMYSEVLEIQGFSNVKDRWIDGSESEDDFDFNRYVSTTSNLSSAFIRYNDPDFEQRLNAVLTLALEEHGWFYTLLRIWDYVRGRRLAK